MKERDIRVIVCGGRGFTDRARLFFALDALHRTDNIVLVIEGGARGADALAKEWAEAHNVPVETVCANWRLGRQAGAMRNAEMLRRNPDLVVAFPGGAGTANMVRQSKLSNVPVADLRGANPSSGASATEGET